MADIRRGMPVVNETCCFRYGVKCGGDLGMWESSGWISPIDPYGKNHHLYIYLFIIITIIIVIVMIIMIMIVITIIMMMIIMIIVTIIVIMMMMMIIINHYI